MVLTLNDILDDLIRPVVKANTQYLILTDTFIEYQLKTLDNTKSLADIPTPAPYKVKELALAFIGFRVCADKQSGAQGGIFRDQAGGDKWANKYKYYKSEFEKLSASITIEQLTGQAVKGKNAQSVTLWRA